MENPEENIFSPNPWEGIEERRKKSKDIVATKRQRTPSPPPPKKNKETPKRKETRVRDSKLLEQATIF